MSEEKTNEDRRIIQKEKLKDLYMSGYFHQLDDLFIASSIQNVSTENNLDLSFLDFNEIQKKKIRINSIMIRTKSVNILNKNSILPRLNFNT